MFQPVFIFGGVVVLKDIFRLKHFEVYPSAGMPTGRVFAEGLKDLKEK